MEKLRILIIGRNKEILKTVSRLIDDNEGWEGTYAATDEEAIEKFHQYPFDVVLLTNGISEMEGKKLRRIFTYQRAESIIIQYEEGRSRMLRNEIRTALDKRSAESKPDISFIDNPLKHARPNINIQY